MGQGRAAEAVLARILRFCRFCGRETPHDVRNGTFGLRLTCVRCRERALQEELDRD